MYACTVCMHPPPQPGLHPYAYTHTYIHAYLRSQAFGAGESNAMHLLFCLPLRLQPRLHTPHLGQGQGQGEAQAQAQGWSGLVRVRVAG